MQITHKRQNLLTPQSEMLSPQYSKQNMWNTLIEIDNIIFLQSLKPFWPLLLDRYATSTLVLFWKKEKNYLANISKDLTDMKKLKKSNIAELLLQKSGTFQKSGMSPWRQK